MLDSKSLKENFFEQDKKKNSRLYLWWIDSDLRRRWEDFSWKFFRRPFFQAKRMYQWYVNVFHKDFDFDAHCVFAIIEYKLKRVEKVLERGHAIQDPKDMKALRLAIKLAGRLKEDSYDIVFFDRHEKKWGQSERWLTPCQDNPNFSTWHSQRPKAVTEEAKNQEREEFRASCLAADAQMCREQKWFYGILDKYLRVWWD